MTVLTGWPAERWSAEGREQSPGDVFEVATDAVGGRRDVGRDPGEREQGADRLEQVAGTTRLELVRKAFEGRVGSEAQDHP
jgi:hypothetical protein